MPSIKWLRMPEKEEKEDPRAIAIWTFRLVIIIIVLGWTLMAISERIGAPPTGPDPGDAISRVPLMPLHLISGLSLILVGLVTFFGAFFTSKAMGSGFGHATRDAVAVAFVVIFLVMFPYALVSPGHFASLFGDTQAGAGTGAAYAQELWDGFKGFLTTIIGFYFAAQVVDKASGDVKESRIEQSQNEAEAAKAKAEADMAQSQAEMARANADAEMARMTMETTRMTMEMAAAERAAAPPTQPGGEQTGPGSGGVG